MSEHFEMLLKKYNALSDRQKQNIDQQFVWMSVKYSDRDRFRIPIPSDNFRIYEPNEIPDDVPRLGFAEFRRYLMPDGKMLFKLYEINN